MRYDLVHAEGVAVRLRALHAAGYSYADLNEMLGRDRLSSFARTLAHRDRATVPKPISDAVFAIPWPRKATFGRRWWEEALCRGWNVARFYPKQGERPDAEALALCSRCPVRDECLDEAVANPEEYGIWGGRTREERALIRRNRNR